MSWLIAADRRVDAEDQRGSIDGWPVPLANDPRTTPNNFLGWPRDDVFHGVIGAGKPNLISPLDGWQVMIVLCYMPSSTKAAVVTMNDQQAGNLQWATLRTTTRSARGSTIGRTSSFAAMAWRPASMRSRTRILRAARRADDGRLVP